LRGVPPCNIQQGESKRASRAFVTPTALNVPYDFVPPFAVHYFLAAIRFFVPSHRFGHITASVCSLPSVSFFCPYSFNFALSRR